MVVDEVALGQILLPVLQFSPVTIIPQMLYTHLHLHVALTRSTNIQSTALAHNGQQRQKHKQKFQRVN
jgi:hypothetical protein